MRNLHRSFQRVFLEPCQITPVAHAAIRNVLLAAMQGDTPFLLRPEDATIQSLRTTGVVGYQEIGDVAIVPLQGIMAKHLSWMDIECGGGCSLETVTEQLHSAADNPRISRIVIYADSPGGACVGTPELADLVAQISARDDKEVIAFTDSQMCSAAYYVCAQADAILATSSAHVGSINTLIYWVDESKRFEMQGMKPELFTEGKFKGMGFPGLSLTDEQRDHLQGRVKVLSEEFHRAVQVGRDNKVPATALEGQTFSGQEAISNGLVDAIVHSIDDALTWQPAD